MECQVSAKDRAGIMRAVQQEMTAVFCTLQEDVRQALTRVREEAAFSEAAEPRVREPQGRASSVKRHCANNAAH